jgi:hypothetical protein
MIIRCKNIQLTFWQLSSSVIKNMKLFINSKTKVKKIENNIVKEKKWR